MKFKIGALLEGKITKRQFILLSRKISPYDEEQFIYVAFALDVEENEHLLDLRNYTELRKRKK